MSARPALPIASRLLAAVLGGYLLASSAIVASGALASNRRAEAIMASSLASFGIYTAAILWAFAARSPRGAWLGLLTPSAALLALAGLSWLARGSA